MYGLEKTGNIIFTLSVIQLIYLSYYTNKCESSRLLKSKNQSGWNYGE